MFKKKKTQAAEAAENETLKEPSQVDKKAEEDAADLDNKDNATGSIRAVLLMAIAIVFLGIVISIAAVFFNQQQLGDSLSKTIDKPLFKVVSTQLENALQARRQLAWQIASESSLKMLLADDDDKQLTLLADRFAAQHPEVLKIRFVQPGFLQVEKTEIAPISYASIDMVRRAAEIQDMPPFEVHSPASSGKHIALAAPVKNDDGALLGIMHIAFSMSVLNEVTDSLDKNLAGVRIQQVVGDNKVELVSSVGFSQTYPLQSMPLMNSIWQLDYHTVPAKLGLSAQWDLLVIAGIGLLIILIMLMLMFLMNKKLLADRENLLTILDKRLKGDKKSVADQFKIAEMQLTWAAIEKLDFSAVKKGSNVFRNKKITRSISPASTDLAPAEVVSANLAEPPPVNPADEKSELLIDEIKKQEVASPKKPQETIKDDLVSDPNKKAFPSKVTQASGDIESSSSGFDLSESVFRAYDIRGVVNDALKVEHAYAIGRAVGTLALNQHQNAISVARDGRLSSPEMADMLIKGLLDTGIDVVNLGLVPSPLLYFATHRLDSKSGIMVTASHNPKQYNGFKIIVNGKNIFGAELLQLHQMIVDEQFISGKGSIRDYDIRPDYIKKITSDINLLNSPSVVVDCGNGSSGVIAGDLLEALGCQVTRLYFEVDGNFPNHHPDPGQPENLQTLIEQVKNINADIGLALDGDGDRLGVVDSEGNIINADRLLMLLSADVLTRNPGADIVYDVKCTRAMASMVLASGGNPVMTNSGHVLIKNKMRETKAPFGGEFSGHMFFAERWYGFDDGLYTAARLLEIMSSSGKNSAQLFADIPESISTPEIIMPVEEGTEHALIDAIQEQASIFFSEARMINIDGIRAEFDDGWGLVRASNTSPVLVFRFEADNQQAMEQVQSIFRSVITMVLPDQVIPF